MSDSRKLYRLLRDDEVRPLKDGIIAKNITAKDAPVLHVRHGSTRASQWISTSKNLRAVEDWIRLKRRREAVRTPCRVVEIDLNELESLSALAAVFDSSRITTSFRWSGQILDFTDPFVVEEHIPVNPAKPKQSEIARGYAKRYSEVLVEHWIPPSCCKRVIVYR